MILKIKNMKLFKSFVYAFNGVKICFTTESNFKIHTMFAVVAIAFGFIFQISKSEWSVIVISICLVIALEMVNTSVEKLCNIVHYEFHQSVKAVKDILAGAVLIITIASAIVGTIIFLPKLLFYVQSY